MSIVASASAVPLLDPSSVPCFPEAASETRMFSTLVAVKALHWSQHRLKTPVVIEVGFQESKTFAGKSVKLVHSCQAELKFRPLLMFNEGKEVKLSHLYQVKVKFVPLETSSVGNAVRLLISPQAY